MGGPPARLPIQVAITIADLPWVGPLPAADSAHEALQRIAAVLRVHDAPATGFVVCDHAEQNKRAIHTWVNWGFFLGNHTAAHRDLNHTPVDAWLADAVCCDKYLERFGGAYTPYFRFPMLHRITNSGATMPICDRAS